jgi:glycerophosphoryl diester phosphodiesterase
MYKLLFLITVILFLTLPVFAGDQKIVIAHRGVCGYLPEHTLQSYVMAYGMGADYIEPDLVFTSDGVFICVHDIFLDDMTDVKEIFPTRHRNDGHYYAIDFTLEEIKSLSVHERVKEDGTPVFPGRFPLGKSKFEIATFSEVIELVQGLNKSTGGNVGIYPEIKSPAFHRKEGKPMERELIKILSKYGYEGKNAKVYIQCFEVDPLKRLRNELKTELTLVQLVGEKEWESDHELPYTKELTETAITEISKYADVVAPEKGRIVKNPDVVKWAHELGLKVHPYTFRADALPVQYKTFEEELNQFYNIYDVDGLFTDFTDRAVKVLKSEK